VLFTVGTAVVLVINYPSLSQQQDRIRDHAANALAVASVVFAAGIFNGILSGTKMIDAMAQSLITIIPEALGPHLAIITALISAPITYFISNDAFYFGIIPIIAKTAGTYGISAAEIARASLLGQPVHMFSPLAPSAYLLVGICGVDFGTFTKFVILPAIGTSLVQILVALALGMIPF
jgi:CitMHS family citrate-Mg2+:H+ or citrate-Ca2+:H+ symporter